MGKRRGRKSPPQDPTTIKNVRLDELFLRPLPTDMTKAALQLFVKQSGFLFRELRLFEGQGNKSAFIRFHCDSDASKALNYFQNVVLDGKTLRVRYTVDYFEDDKEPTEKCNESISKIRMAFSWIDKHCRTEDSSRLPQELAELEPRYYIGARQLGGLMNKRCSDKHPQCRMFDGVYNRRDKVEPSFVELLNNEVGFDEIGAKMKVLQSEPDIVDPCSRPFSMVDQFLPRAKQPFSSTPTKGFGRGRIKQSLSSLPPLTPITSPPTIIQKTSSTITDIINNDTVSASTKLRQDDVSSASSGIFSDADLSDNELSATMSQRQNNQTSDATRGSLSSSIDTSNINLSVDNSNVNTSVEKSSIDTSGAKSSINECGVSPRKGLGRGAGVLQLVRDGKLLIT